MLYLFCSVQFASTSTCQLPACLIRTDGCSIVTHEFVNTIYQWEGFVKDLFQGEGLLANGTMILLQLMG